MRLQDKDDFLKIQLKEEFAKSVTHYSDPKLQVLKDVLNENGAELMKPGEFIGVLGEAMQEIGDEDKQGMSWWERAQLKMMSKLFSWLERMEQKIENDEELQAKIDIKIDEVLARVNEDDSEQLKTVLATDERLQNIVMSVE